MTREEFIKKTALLGLGTAFLPSLLTSCKEEDEGFEVNFSGRVIIIGAGAAGLMAGHLLQQHNIDFEILEADTAIGGRVKKLEGFTDFPIDLGAEWIHTDPSVFGELIQDDNIEGNIELIPYDPQTYQTWHNGRLRNQNWVSNLYSEYKFKKTTWFDFFEQYIVPPFASRIRTSTPVTAIDYAGDQIEVVTDDGTSFKADKVIVTVPLTILQKGLIDFAPALPANKLDALEEVSMPDGLKVFLKMKERFYPDMLMMHNLVGYFSKSHLYIDGAFKKDTSDNLLTLFSVDTEATQYTSLGSDSRILTRVLDELDEIFDGKASANLEKSHVQNWSAQPYIQGSYSHYDNNFTSVQNALRETVDRKLYFAGEAYHEEASSTVHGAGFSGIDAAKAILKGE
ncbi:MAG: flavin monoamine oxidase family protein [Salibacteraceae bacterium]